MMAPIIVHPSHPLSTTKFLVRYAVEDLRKGSFVAMLHNIPKLHVTYF